MRQQAKKKKKKAVVYKQSFSQKDAIICYVGLIAQRNSMWGAAMTDAVVGGVYS